LAGNLRRFPLNVRAVSAKIKLPKLTFAPKLTPREKIGFEVINISIKKTLHVISKQNGARF